MPVAEKEQVTFIAKCANLSLTMSPEVPEARLPNGTILREKEARRAVQFDNYRFSTDDLDTIEWLRQHRLLNQNVHNGFFEDGAPPDEPLPRMRDQKARINELARKGDAEALGELIEEEKATHDREAVITPAEAALYALAGDEEKKPSQAPPSKTSKTTSTT